MAGNLNYALVDAALRHAAVPAGQLPFYRWLSECPAEYLTVLETLTSQGEAAARDVLALLLQESPTFHTWMEERFDAWQRSRPPTTEP